MLNHVNPTLHSAVNRDLVAHELRMRQDYPMTQTQAEKVVHQNLDEKYLGNEAARFSADRYREIRNTLTPHTVKKLTRNIQQDYRLLVQ